jgi:Domain of unknown function (DUF4399)
MERRALISFVCLVLGLLIFENTANAQAQSGGPTPSAPGAAVYFVGLKDGDTISPKTTIHFGLRGMGVAPAGSDRMNSGHHHLIIDAPTPPLNVEIPNDSQHLHFGAGQTETDLVLAPGEHTLQLVLGDKNHVPHNPPVVSERIKVKVAEQASPPPPQAFSQGRQGLFHLSDRRGLHQTEHRGPFWPAQHGRRPGRLGQAKHGPPSSADRHQSAPTRPACA